MEDFCYNLIKISDFEKVCYNIHVIYKLIHQKNWRDTPLFPEIKDRG